MKITDTLTYKDIREIPVLLASFSKNADRLKKLTLKSRRGRVYLVGRGSSGNATLFAKYVWEEFCGVASNIIHPYSVFSARKEIDFGGEVVWAFSQSGRSGDIVKCLKKLMLWGASGVAVTNEPNISKNLLAQAAGNNVLLSYSKELPVAATKSFALQLWLVLRTAKLWGAGFFTSDFNKTIFEIERFTGSLPDFGNDYVEKIKDRSFVGFVGRGPFNAIAEDSALKFREMAGVHSLGYSAAEFLHGPIGSFGPKDFVFLFNHLAKLSEDIRRVKKSLLKRKVPFAVMSEKGLKYPFNALLADVKMKFIALKLAVCKGLNPDKPRGLKKITQTF